MSEEKYLEGEKPKQTQDTDIKDITYNEHTLTLAQLEEKWKVKVKEVSLIGIFKQSSVLASKNVPKM